MQWPPTLSSPATHPTTWGEPRVETGRRKAPESKTTWTGGRWEGMRHSLQLPVLCGNLYQQAPLPNFWCHLYPCGETVSPPDARKQYHSQRCLEQLPLKVGSKHYESSYKKTSGQTSSESGKELPHSLFRSQLWDLSHFGSHLPFQSKLPFPLPWKQVFIIEAGTGF